VKQYDPMLPLFSLHVHKCGGSSLRNIYKFWFRPFYFPHYYISKNDKLPFKIPAVNALAKVRPLIIHGHFNYTKKTSINYYYPKAKQFISSLRDPLQAHISSYFYIKKCIRHDSMYIKGKKTGKCQQPAKINI
jgi:hypothetical protein